MDTNPGRGDDVEPADMLRDCGAERGGEDYVCDVVPAAGGALRGIRDADSIARGLSPLNEAAVQMEAGRLFIARLHELQGGKQSLAFETTLSGRGHGKVIRGFRDASYRIELNYLWIPSADFSAQRVASRVANGGHDIPAEAIARRYGKSLWNLVNLYMGLADYVAVWDNSEERPRRVYERDEDGETVLDEDIWKRIKECVA